jgi:hypothetical protein
MVDLIKGIALHYNEIWAQVLICIAALGAFIKGVETILQIIAPLTPFKWDDNLATVLGKFLAFKIFQKK